MDSRDPGDRRVSEHTGSGPVPTQRDIRDFNHESPLPVRELPVDRMGVIAELQLPHRAVASVGVPSGRIVVALVSDSAVLSHMFAGHWARASRGAGPDATLYLLAGPARDYGLGSDLDAARWWSRRGKAMAVFGGGSYRLAKTCVRGICSAVSGDDMMFLHGCALSLGRGEDRRGMVVTGCSGAGKTTLVARLLERPEYRVTVVNDDWGAVSLESGRLVSTGERKLHMKASSVRALRPGFFSSAPAGAYSYDPSEHHPAARLLATPESVYGVSWSTGEIVLEQVAIIVREAPGWTAPRDEDEAVKVLKSGGYSDYFRHHEAFFNGSLLATPREVAREEQRYRRLLKHVSLSWINNCGTPEELVESFLSATKR
jgi:CobW/HypB/UreG, nucleotide-binding domain